MTNKLIHFLLGIMLLSAKLYANDSILDECAKPTTQAEIAALFDRWNQDLQTLNPDKVVANYDIDATLLATFSKKMKKDHAAIRAYFVKFLQKKPIGHINERRIVVNCPFAVDTGLYTFSILNEAGKREDVAARYTFVYVKKKGRWLIENHHSSGLPE